MSTITLRRHDLTLVPEISRVILRPFIPANAQRITTLIGRALALTEARVGELLAALRLEFADRHFDLEATLLAQFERVAAHVFTDQPLSLPRWSPTRTRPGCRRAACATS